LRNNRLRAGHEPEKQNKSPPRKNTRGYYQSCASAPVFSSLVALVAESPKRRSALSGYAYASEFSDGRFGSTSRPHKRKKMGKGLDPGLLIGPPNAESRLKPGP
jgi:hypothetical protein